MTATYNGTIDTVALVVQVGNGDGPPETFTAPVVVNAQRGINFSAAATAAEVVRTDDPTQPAKIVRTVTSVDSSISGQGTLDHATAKTYADWILTGAAKNMKVMAGSAAGDLLVSGSYVLTKFEITGAKHGDLVTATLQWDQADLPTITAHA